MKPVPSTMSRMNTSSSDETLATPLAEPPWVTTIELVQLFTVASAGTAIESSPTLNANALSAAANATGGRNDLK